MRRPLRRRRDRGFSLIVVFLLVMVMVGVAAAVAMSTQEDLSVSGQDREAKTAFYAAEYAVAAAKDWLAGQTYDPVTGWTNTLKAGGTQLCTPGNGSAPGTSPQMLQAPLFKEWTPGNNGDAVSYQWCVHNNADDPAYAQNPPTGDTNDSVDNLHYLVIEAYGYYGAPTVIGTTAYYKATAHVAATVGAPGTQAVSPQNCYSQEGGCGAHLGNAGTLEAGIAINTSVVKGF